jgi:hypothetical protein
MLKMTYLIMPACANIRRKYSPDSPIFAKPCCADSPDSPTFANLFCSDSPNSPKFASGFARTRQTRRNLPKVIFEKNVTRLAKFMRVIRVTSAAFASSHCLCKNQSQIDSKLLVALHGQRYWRVHQTLWKISKTF